MTHMKMPMDLTGSDEYYPKEPNMPWEHGPAVHFTWKEDYNFPDEGVMTVKFRVKSREENINSKMEKTFHVAIELLEIQKIKESACCAPASSHDEAGKAMDKLRAEAESDED